MRTLEPASGLARQTSNAISQVRLPVPLSFHTRNRRVAAAPYVLYPFPAHNPSYEADMPIMDERRIEPRMLCAELVELRWRDKHGFERRDMANLEDISLSGACLQTEKP